MAKMTLVGNQGVLETAALVKELAPKLGSSVELRGEICHAEDGAGLYLMVFEKYYMRSQSYTSLTVAVSGDTKSSFVDVIGAGGGTGIFNISWGSEQDFTEDFCERLQRLGFTKIETS